MSPAHEMYNEFGAPPPHDRFCNTVTAFQARTHTSNIRVILQHAALKPSDSCVKQQQKH